MDWDILSTGRYLTGGQGWRPDSMLSPGKTLQVTLDVPTAPTAPAATSGLSSSRSTGLQPGLLSVEPRPHTASPGVRPGQPGPASYYNKSRGDRCNISCPLQASLAISNHFRVFFHPSIYPVSLTNNMTSSFTTQIKVISFFI